MYMSLYKCSHRRKFRSQTSGNIWTDEKQSREEAERRERVEERRSEKRKSQKKVDADARKGRKVAKHCVFPMIWGSGGSKSRLAKAAGAQTSGEMRDEKLHAVVARSRFRSEKIQNTSAPDRFWKLRCWKSALWREAHLEVKCVKNWGVRSSFGSWDDEKVHGVVARSTFPTQNVQNTTCSRHFWKLRCRKKCTPLWREAHFQLKMYKTPHVRATFGSCDVEKSARRCGAKHISKSKCTKHYMFGPLLEVRMLKKCTPLWREAHFQVKMFKTLGVRTTFGGSDVASLRFTTLHSTTLHSITLHYTTLHYTQLHYYTTLQYLPLHFTTLHYSTLHYTTTTTTQLHPLHSTTLHYITLHYITLHYTTLPSTTLHYITLHYTPLHYKYNYNYTTLHSTRLHYTKLHYTTLHCTTLHYIPLHSTTLHNITLHYITLNDTAPQIDR